MSAQTSAAMTRDARAIRGARWVYLDAYWRCITKAAEHSGHPLTARKWRRRAATALRAYWAEITDPEPRP